MATSFKIESSVRGHHVCKDVWSPVIGDEFLFQVGEHNTFDEFAVAVMKNSDEVGHVPRKILNICWFFPQKKLQQHHLSNNRRKLSTIHGKGLVVPCI